MALLPAWAINGGRVPASMARRMTWASTSGSTGIVLPGDLRVVPRAQAGSGVIIMPGGGLIESRFPGGTAQSYMVYNDAALDVPVTATGSTGGRTDILGIRIDDPEFPGNATPADPLTAAYSRPVLVPSIPTTYPFLPLARIVQPASNSTVTAAMITSLREMARPRRQRDLRALGQLPGRDNQLVATAATGEQFPNDGVFSIEVPTWATQVKVVATLSGISVPPGTAYGATWVRLGHGRSDVINTQQSVVDLTSARADPSRVMTMSADTRAVPASMRGQSITVLLIGRKLGGSVNLKADANTAFALDLEWVEAPAEDF